MSDHYYSQKPTSKSNPSHFREAINSITLDFHTDEGVFSKKQVDYGTRALLNNFKQPETLGDILDVGCGYGPIGLTLAKMYPKCHIVMIDVNERAIRLAKENQTVNRVPNVDVVQSDGLKQIRGRQFATVITNPPFRAGKALVHQIVEDSYDVLVHEGEFWVVVQKKQGAPSLKEKIKKVFGNVDVIKRDKGYFILRGKKFDSGIPV
ncbi:class I SAM-dependent methyltransferase [Tenuibacillus multivorans]|uniref:16S rRNA (Guanine1207-N2)-methyltransferase n=1 Tax=Tenuibacillus multivorans TaxID=237069 RepID=A0A1H0F4D2_9BACI|nr:class I SAM-dependent methyltransferase [Tenuibacillus multivorans]GEL78077.1 hypothetical protein TMU01_23120 [Tenuibacillus multivorans]SDN89528.1 16S rRNA (guanine1207-N2)-methyltransferase [Tenuibacillus multivorans]